MSRAGYLNLRITPARRANLDTLRRVFGTGGRTLTYQEIIDFSIEWTLASIPDRFTKRTATRLVAAVEDATAATAQQARSNTAVAVIRARLSR